VSLIGTGFFGRASECAACGSVERLRAFMVFMVPVVPLGRYRLIEFGRTTGLLLSRRVPGPTMTPRLWRKVAALAVLIVVATAALVVGLGSLAN
jgi:hypothetical protein